MARCFPDAASCPAAQRHGQANAGPLATSRRGVQPPCEHVPSDTGARSSPRSKSTLAGGFHASSSTQKPNGCLFLDQEIGRRAGDSESEALKSSCRDVRSFRGVRRDLHRSPGPPPGSPQHRDGPWAGVPINLMFKAISWSKRAQGGEHALGENRLEGQEKAQSEPTPEQVGCFWHCCPVRRPSRGPCSPAQ